MKKVLTLLSSVLLFGFVYSQHDHHQHTKDTITKPKVATHQGKGHDEHGRDTSKPAKKSDQHDHDLHGQDGMGQEPHNMSHAYSINLPMNRNGSGTGWLPDESPMYGYMFHKNKWMY